MGFSFKNASAEAASGDTVTINPILCSLYSLTNTTSPPGFSTFLRRCCCQSHPFQMSGSMGESGWKYQMEVTKTVRCNHMSDSAGELLGRQPPALETGEDRGVYSAYKMRSGQESEEDAFQ